MYIVIGYKNISIDGSISTPLYLDETEKYFSSLQDAEEYRNFLSTKYSGLQICLTSVIVEQSIDITELKRKEALLKLTEEEKQLLGLN